MTELKRLLYAARTKADVAQYYQTRALQLAWNGYSWTRELTDIPGGFKTQFTKDGKTFDSFYILAQNLYKGFGKHALEQITNPIVTVADCAVVDFLERFKVEHVVETGIYDTVEYKLIENYYGTRSPKRAPVFLMNHIDEGVLILQRYGIPQIAQQAFCLHPLLQDDKELAKHFDEVVTEANPRAVALALEYRNTANAYLSQRSITSIDEIVLSPLPHVNFMLVADKIQNRKDFEQYHKGTHPRSAELDKYFKNWLEKLAVDDIYDDVVAELLTINPKVQK